MKKNQILKLAEYMVGEKVFEPSTQGFFYELFKCCVKLKFRFVVLMWYSNLFSESAR